MRISICTCDRCGKEITNGVVYTLTCYAEDIGRPHGVSVECVQQNIRQNFALQQGQKELCEECKDELTDGLFIL